LFQKINKIVSFWMNDLIFLMINEYQNVCKKFGENN